jgi:MFS family permease
MPPPVRKADSRARDLRGLPRGVWALGLVSLFMDISTEMIQSILPMFLVSVLGASPETVGLIEGVGEATASMTKMFSGWLSDALGRRKLLVGAGYAVGAVMKPVFALATSVSWVLGARFVDRVGKGIRGAPRDALIGDLAPAAQRGAAYGLRQSLDTLGAVLGPLIALALMERFHDRFRLVMGWAVLPGLVSVATVVLAVREPVRAPASGTRARAAPIDWRDRRSLSGTFWMVVAVGAVLTLARFSEAFLILRAREAGMRVALVPLVLVLMNVVYAITAYPLGALSDRWGRERVLAAGFAMLIAADIALALAPGIGAVMAGVALWGLQMGLTQGQLAAWVADSAPGELRASAFGVFNLATGIVLLASSLLAGALWQVGGSRATFLAGAAFTVLGLLGLALLARARRARVRS